MRQVGSGHRFVVVAHSAQLGGAELGLARYLNSDLAVRATAIVMESGPLVDLLKESGVAVRVAPAGGFIRRHAWLRHELRGTSGVVLSTTLRAALWVAMSRLRRIGHGYYVQDFINGGFFSAPKRAIASLFILRRAQFLLVNSSATWSALPDRAKRLPHWLVYTASGVSSDGISIARRHLAEAPATADGSAGLRILYLGRITEWKGVDVIIDACERLNAQWPGALTSLTLAGGSFFGEENYRRTITDMAARSAAPIEVLDHQRDIQPLLARADVLVHASTTPEPFGQVLVQAMASGVPVVASAAGGPLEILNGAGLLHAPGDSEALAGCLAAYWRDADLRVAKARAALREAERFTDDAVASLITSALEAAAALQSGPA